MKLYISYALASLLVAAPVMASHDDADKAAQKKVTQQDDEVNSAPVAKKIAQILWKHKGKVAAGTSLLILAAIAYWYHESILAFCGWEKNVDLNAATVVQKDAPVTPVQENVKTAQLEVPLQATDEKNIMTAATFTAKMEKAPELGNKEMVELSNEMVREDRALAIVTNKSDKTIVVSPVPPSEKDQAVAALELIPVPLTDPETTPTVTPQELPQTSKTSSEVSVMADDVGIAGLTNADEVMNSGHPWAIYRVFGKLMGLFPRGETPSIAETTKPADVTAAPSIDQNLPDNQQS